MGSVLHLFFIYIHGQLYLGKVNVLPLPHTDKTPVKLELHFETSLQQLAEGLTWYFLLNLMYITISSHIVYINMNHNIFHNFNTINPR